MTPTVVESVATVGVWVAAGIPAVRVFWSRPIRREAQVHPGLAALAAAAMLAALGLAGWLIMREPLWSRLLTGLLLLGWLMLWLHARVAYGQRRGLPPGSLGLTTSLAAIDDPSFYAGAAAAHGPVFKMQQVHRPVACVTDLGLGHDLLSREEARLGQSEWSFNRLVPGGYLEYMEGEPHLRYREVFARGFTPEVVEGARGAMAEVSRTQLEVMASSASDAGIHPEPFLYDVPFISLLHTVLGVGRDHEDLPALRAGFALITVPFEVHLPTPPSIARGYADLVRMVGGLAQVAASSPTPSVLREVVRANPAHAADPTVLGNLVLMVKEGSIMVRGLLRWVLKVLASEPPQGAVLRAAAQDPGLLEAASVAFVRETLRLHESRYLYRTAREAVTLGGFRIPRGWLVRLCVGEAHEDPRHFPEPTRFDPMRFRGALPGPERYCPFGTGTHACLGDGITLAIASTFVREAALGWEWRTVSDGPPWRINRHWGLWRPSPEFRVTLTPRPGPSHAA
jgi:cytochrome P450